MGATLSTVLEPSEWRQSQSSSPSDRAAGVNRAGRRALLLLAVLALLWGLWEGYRALGTQYGWTHPFTVDATTMSLCQNFSWVKDINKNI